jgi:uncharacterized membrane protein (UPF0127 family)
MMITFTSRFRKITLVTLSGLLFVSVQACALQNSVNQADAKAPVTDTGLIQNRVQTKAQTKALTKEKAQQTVASDELAFDAMSDEEADAWLAAQDENDGKIVLNFQNDTAIRVEYADTPQERQLGLMYRRSLCDDCGMLFKFDSNRVGSIWMKNTFIPLDLAYISADGTIVDIFQLAPHDLTPVRSTSKVLYALEMNKGWFAKKDIRAGEKVTNLP